MRGLPPDPSTAGGVGKAAAGPQVGLCLPEVSQQPLPLALSMGIKVGPEPEVPVVLRG